MCHDNFILAKIPETREVCMWSGNLARELVTNYKEVEPLFTISQPYKDVLEPNIEKIISKI